MRILRNACVRRGFFFTVSFGLRYECRISNISWSYIIREVEQSQHWNKSKRMEITVIIVRNSIKNSICWLWKMTKQMMNFVLIWLHCAWCVHICKVIIKSDTHDVISIERGVEQRAKQRWHGNCIATWWTKWTIKRHKFITKRMYKVKKAKAMNAAVNLIRCSATKSWWRNGDYNWMPVCIAMHPFARFQNAIEFCTCTSNDWCVCVVCENNKLLRAVHWNGVLMRWENGW